MFFSKKPYTEATIEMDNYMAFVKFDGNVSSIDLATLLIYYLARYFYICDDRQFIPMKELLLEYFNSKKLDYNAVSNLMMKIEAMIYESFNNKEREALAKYMNVARSLPNLVTTEPIEKTKYIYFFKIFKSNNGITTNLKMPLILNKQILPRTVNFMIDAVATQMSAKDHTKLKRAGISFLNNIGAERGEINLLINSNPQTESLEEGFGA